MSLTTLPVELKRRILDQLPWRVRWQVLQVDRALFHALDQDAIDGVLRLLAAAPTEAKCRLSHGLRAWLMVRDHDGSWVCEGLTRQSKADPLLPVLEGAFTGVGRRYRVWLQFAGDREPQGF